MENYKSKTKSILSPSDFSVEDWDSLYKQVPVHILLLDRDLKIVYANYAGSVLTIDDLIGKPIITFVKKERKKEIKTLLNKALRRGKIISYETEYVNPEDEITHYETEAVQWKKNGEILGLILLSRDISEKNEIQDELRVSEEKFRDMVEKINDVIYTTNMEGVITYLNPAIESLIGLTPEQVVGQKFTQFIHHKDLRRIEDNFRDLLSGVVSDPTEYRVISPLGKTRWVHVSSQPLIIKGRVTGVRGVLTDITENKLLDEQIEEKAVTKERDRLARILHDSITQNLFSASVIAESTPRIMDNDPDLAKLNMEKVSIMLRSSLADMRTMLIELQPAELVGKSLDELIMVLIKANQAKINFPIALDINGEKILPDDVTIMFYRTAQESISNIIKHADADEASIHLDFNEDDIMMIVKDNGCGFLTEKIPPGHFGLKFMAERVKKIGGDLKIESKPGYGTQVTLSWSEQIKEVNRE